MRHLFLVAPAMLFAVTACVSQKADLVNDRGQVVQCTSDGWGLLGAPVALSMQAECIKKAKAAGFQKQAIPGATSSPTVVATPLTPASRVSAFESVSPPEITAAAPVATAPSADSGPGASPQSLASGSPADRLKKLEEVYKSGLISKDEYDRKRQEILSTL